MVRVSSARQALDNFFMTLSAPRMPVAVIGAGAMGRMHVARMLTHPDVVPAGAACRR